ncbi:DC-STAMP domain-containing protein 2-like [Spea bombifrons]|uniref:DC-STAMP domain-containing protein 2-like n=1 Tax=Spea bombifrons TaxID=233779 RepID=UPI00234A681D|nr:DC-STAMP domain-containing protein 2-like [Spea bombifrons]
MGTTLGPWEWMCTCCKTTCGLCRRACPCACSCNCPCSCKCPCKRKCPCDCPCDCPRDCDCPCDCSRDCLSNLCPEEVKVEEVSAEDYIDEDKKEVRAQLREDNAVKSSLRSCGAFTFGLILTAMYAAIVLFVKNYSLKYCIVSSVVICILLTLGMAFFMKMRVTVFLMLPQLFSIEGKTIVLLVAFSLALQGPAANTLENFRRSSESVSCGVELAMNQTKELLEKVKRPLVSALDILRNIGQRLKGVADRARKFFKTVTDGVKHIGRVLRNVWRFIANIGEVCNEELEVPYLKCRKIFDTARNQCFQVMPFLSFLCYIVDAFKPLCGLAKTATILCLLPKYLQKYVRKHVKNPIINMLRNIKDKFEFNVTVIHDFDINLNSSKSIKQVAVGIMSEVQSTLNPYLDVLSMFSYSMTFVCLFIYIMAARYQRKYLYEDNHDNIYITRSFIELDVMRAKQGRRTLLPLSAREAYNFILPGSLYLTKRERKGYSFDIINVFRNVLVVAFMMVMDFIIYWVLDMVYYLLQADVVARAPVTFSVLINGSGYASEIFSNVVSAFDILQRGNLTVLSKKCLVAPSAPDFKGYILIGSMYGLCFLIAIFGVYIRRLQRVICAYYYPSREQERICFLYNNLITKRTNIEDSLIRSVRMNAEDGGHSSFLQVLAAKLPGCRWFAQLLGTNEQYCMACAKTITGSEGQDCVACITPGCKGMYCRGCFEILNNICTICMAPLAYSEAIEEEVDSSDEEQVHLWIDAMKTIKAEEKGKRKKLKEVVKDRLKQVLRSQGSRAALGEKLLEKYKEEVRGREEDESSGISEVESSEDSEDTDFEYQNSTEDTDSSDSEDHTTPPFTKWTEARRKRDLVTPARQRPPRRRGRRAVKNGGGN